jgi:hypothetical protein
MFSVLPIALLILTWPYSYSEEMREFKDEYKQWKKEVI